VVIYSAGIISFGVFTGRIIGGAGFSITSPGTRFSDTTAFFFSIEPTYRGKGIGTEAIHAIHFLETEVKNRGYHLMECQVAATNPRAIRLYQHPGYEVEGKKNRHSG
jgi:RimJ/RimL family protein N-acetyltransferase